MSPEAVSPLRRRMIEDMTIRQFGEHTQRAYIRQVRAFTAFLGRSPDQAEPEDLRRYQLHLASCGASYARMNQASTALRFFFHVTLARRMDYADPGASAYEARYRQRVLSNLRRRAKSLGYVLQKADPASAAIAVS